MSMSVLFLFHHVVLKVQSLIVLLLAVVSRCVCIARPFVSEAALTGILTSSRF